MNRALLGLITASMIGLPRIAPAETGEECVILLHGLVRGPASMQVMHWALDYHGYRVVNASYPSTEALVEDLAMTTLPRAPARCAGAEKVHFVTHSMGAILLRYYAAQHSIPNAGRAVLMAPPNGGSEIVDQLGHLSLFETIHGPAGLQLKTAPEALPRRLPAPRDLEVGIIAGTQSLNPFTSAMIEEPDDGKVSVKSAFALAARDTIDLPVTHTWMMMNPGVIARTVCFLESGRFTP